MNQERSIVVPSGWTQLGVTLILWLSVPALFILTVVMGNSGSDFMAFLFVVAAVIALIAAIFMTKGFLTIQPNQSVVLLLFGKYVGTVRESGFFWTNPFYTRLGVSLRLQSFEGKPLKVNDKRGNPIEIAAVVVWSVKDTAQACFDVSNYFDFVKLQSETALRHLANSYAYDHSGDEAQGELTLRGEIEEISKVLREELEHRLAPAGVQVSEARLTHLAYAPEIAGVMLRRQQAEAVIAARQKIVHGAVSMVQMALQELNEKNVIQLNDDRKAAMVSNLLVVLCGEQQAQPVVSTSA